MAILYVSAVDLELYARVSPLFCAHAFSHQMLLFVAAVADTRTKIVLLTLSDPFVDCIEMGLDSRQAQHLLP